MEGEGGSSKEDCQVALEPEIEKIGKEKVRAEVQVSRECDVCGKFHFDNVEMRHLNNIQEEMPGTQYHCECVFR